MKSIYFLFIVYSYVSSVDISSFTPSMHNRAGVKLSNEGKVKLALKHFRMAVQAEPRNAGYKVNCGVAEMRLALFENARMNFIEALEIEPMNDLAMKNMAVLKKVAPMLFQKPWTNRNMNTRKTIKRLSYEDILDPLNVDYLNGNLPFILTGTISKFEFEKFFTILQNFKNEHVDFYPENLTPYKTANYPLEISLSVAIEELANPNMTIYNEETGNSPPYIQWNLDDIAWRNVFLRLVDYRLPNLFLYESGWVSSCLNESLMAEFIHKTYWRTVMIGNEGSGMYNHVDLMKTASWQFQAKGKKLWHICDPLQESFMYEGKVDSFNPNYELFPNFSYADCFEDTVTDGEYIFYPGNWWHQTRCMTTPCIGIASALVDQNNWKAVSSVLDDTFCQNSNHSFSSDLCNSMKVCSNIWKNDFQINKRRTFM